MRDALGRLAEWSESKRARNTVLAGILLYGIAFYLLGSAVHIPGFQSRQKTTGLSAPQAERFVYFQYYLGLFPIATMNPSPELTYEGALNELKQRGSSLIMEVEHWSRLGEHARIWTYLPNAWLRGSAKNPSIRLFNTLVFITCLLTLYFGFCSAGMPLIGTILTAMVAFTPYFIYEIFGRQNVFGLLGSGFFIILGLLSKSVLKGASTTMLLIITVALGAMVGFLSEIRNETIILTASIMALILFAKKQLPVFKITAIVFALIAVLATKAGIRVWFEKEYQEASLAVQENGGHVYNGKRVEGHRFWHPVFCGLGDFDTKYGYQWDDRVAYAYAVPLLKEKYQLDVKWSGKFHTDNYYDADSIYYVKFDEIPEYETLMREKVMTDITSDPWWYLEILLKRLIALLTYTIPLPLMGWLIFPALWIIIKEKDTTWMAFLLAALPLAATPLMIYAGDGATYNCTYAFILIAFFISYYLKNGIHKKRPA